MSIPRCELVRRLLGSATQLFLDDADPISVHCLAATAADHSDKLAEAGTGGSLKGHILSTYTDSSEQKLLKIRNQFWRVIKHPKDFRGNDIELEEELKVFDDSKNDSIIFYGWFNYFKIGEPSPIEAQVFQV
ncbi:MAG: hypothetical protein AAGC81_10915 [Pseudomonadota bacterium]